MTQPSQFHLFPIVKVRLFRMRFRVLISFLILTFAGFHITVVHTWNRQNRHGQGRAIRGRGGPSSHGKAVDQVDWMSSLLAFEPSTRATFNGSTILALPNGTFVDFVRGCVPIVTFCLLNSVGPICPLACLLDNSKVARHLTHLIPPVVRSLCNSVGSSLDTKFQHFVDEMDRVKTVGTFLDNFDASTPSKRKQFSGPSVSALPMLMIKYLRSPILDLLKPVIFSLSAEVAVAPLDFGDKWKYLNPTCPTTDLSGSETRLAEKIIKSPFVADVSLGGWFLLSNLVTMKVEKAEVSELFHSIFKVMGLMAGVQCSLVQFAATGKVTDCQFAMGKSWKDPSLSKPLLVDVCGGLPDVPPLDLNQLFPDIFQNKIKVDDEVPWDPIADSNINVETESPLKL